MRGNRLRLAHNVLRISDPAASLTFYQEQLGMELLEPQHLPGASRWRLAFAADPHAGEPTELELWHDAAADPTADIRPSSGGYWKIGITLPDVDVARERLLARGIAVGAPQQFYDIGYLCHLADPDGYVIELLQHDFLQHHQPITSQPHCPLGCKPTLGQITLRIADPEASLRFYQQGLGMRLLSRQIVEPHRFTLYFLACTDETPPDPNLDAVGNREWLWQRPYTTLELQHRWDVPEVATDSQFGFWGIGFVVQDLSSSLERVQEAHSVVIEPEHRDPCFDARGAIVTDPDGFRVRLIEAI
ncbi:MAG: VOC family protein [Pseudomonadota bacterium]